MAPGVGLEPTTSKLTASCSTIELPGINYETNLRFFSSLPTKMEYILAGCSFPSIRA